MPVYPTMATDTNCASQGCRCHARTPRYPSDLTDAQWAMLEPEARAVMAGLVRASGRPMVHDLRAMLDAVGYVTRYGIEWRTAGRLPAVRGGVRVLRTVERAGPAAAAGRCAAGPNPPRVRARCAAHGRLDRLAEREGRRHRGWREEDQRPQAAHRRGHPRAAARRVRHPGQRPRPRRRPPAAGAAAGRFSTIRLVWADGGYAGRLLAWASSTLRLAVTVVKRSDDTTGFVVLPRRWVVERTFGWLLRHRRLVRDYE